jgi:pyruvate,water dikinase
MVSAEASGIMFTANAVTGTRDEIVIDAAWGLGEAVVGGLVNPDHVVVDEASGEIREVAVAEKALMTVPVAAGTEERPVEAGRRRTRVLDDRQAAELAKLGAAIEDHYGGAPQDIEWRLVDDRFWIVQSRPITTLPPEPVRWDSPVPGAKWMNDLQAAKWASEPLSPLGATTTFPAMITARQRQYPLQKSLWYALINGWLYIRVDCRVLQMVIRPAWWVLRMATGTLDGHRQMRRTWPSQLTLLASLERTEPAKLSDQDLHAHADRLLEVLGWWWQVSWYAAAAILGEQLIRKLKVPGLAEPAVLFRGNDSLLLEAERALRHAADTGEVEAYLARFGHFVESADPLHPTLRESPDLLSQYLAVARHSKMGPDERLVRTRRERGQAERLVRTLRGSRGFVTRRVLKSGQSYAAHTDDAVFHFQRVLALVRATFLEAGQRLARAGAIEQAEDVFYLQAGEVWARPAADLTERITQRRRLRERHKRLAPPPFIPPLSDPAWGKDPVFKLMKSLMGPAVIRRGAQERDGRRVLVGMPGSPGRARGIARLITGPDDFHRFQPGDVLVAHATTPIWTPLFNIASAAVTEVGGNFSHAAIVAREFGIPLVNGALNATQIIVDGMSVVVDGSAGIVEL